MEVDNKNLRTVIAQLRQARRATTGEEENAVAERDELKVLCASLQADVNRLERQVANISEHADSALFVKVELTQTVSALRAAEEALDDARRRIAQLERDCYYKDTELDVTRSDILLVRQELQQRCIEVSNLKDALSQVTEESTFKSSRFQRELNEKLDDTRRQADLQLKLVEEEWHLKLQDEVSKRIIIEQTSQDRELLLRKAEMDFSKEKVKMQRTLEGALAQLSNSQRDVIDRTLVANLIVSYFKRKR